MTCSLGSAQDRFAIFPTPAGQPATPGEHAPQLNKGFYSTSADPLSVYLCEPTYICTGGSPGDKACAGDRMEFMCVGCPDAYVSNDEQEDDETASGCTKCVTMMLVYIIAVPIIGLVASFALLLDAKHSPLDDNPCLVELKMISGQCIMFLQILGCLSAAHLSFGNPMTNALTSLAEPIDLNQFFISMPCIASGFTDAVMMFAVQVTFPAVFVLLLVVTFFILTTLRPGLIKADGLLNAVGEVLIEFYVSITIAVLAPMNCYEHPNGTQSMKGRPDILCGEGDHVTMMVLSMLALLVYPVACFGITIIATWQHPKRMARNDIGMLVRCHFIFNRWRPQCYWFAIPAVSRNFFVALWPMVIPEKENDVAVMLMIATLLIALLLLCLIQPRRTPAMGALDVQISSIQLMILGVGAMSIYSGTLKSNFMSWCLMLMTISIAVTSSILVLLKGLQYLSKNRSPGSWCFDIFLDHHAASGGNAVRVLQVFLTSAVQRGKVFYDVDWYMANKGVLGVITDAAKLSKNCLVVLGNETWCRDWCVAAIISAASTKVPLQTITTGENRFRSFDVDFSMSIVDTLAKQAPREKLRPVGLNDASIPEAMKMVFKIKPLAFSMSDQEKMQTFATTLMNTVTGVVLKQGVDVPASTAKYFSKAKAGAASAGSWFDKTQDYALISADHDDAEGVAVSRLIYSLLVELIEGTMIKGASISGGKQPGAAQRAPLDNSRRGSVIFEATTFTQQERVAAQDLRFIEDIDLSASEVKGLVETGKVSVVLVIFTSRSFQSVPQLLRLGLVHKHAHQTRFKPIPLSIGDCYKFPGIDVLTDIESGAVLSEDIGEEQAAMNYTGGSVSFPQARQALQHVMDYRISLVNVPLEGVAALRKSLIEVLFRLVHAVDDSEYGTNKSTPIPLTFVATDSIMNDPGKLFQRQETLEKKKLDATQAPTNDATTAAVLVSGEQTI
jgi:hypothetical protein